MGVLFFKLLFVSSYAYSYVPFRLGPLLNLGNTRLRQLELHFSLEQGVVRLQSSRGPKREERGFMCISGSKSTRLRAGSTVH